LEKSPRSPSHLGFWKLGAKGISVTQKRRSLWDGVFYWRGITEHSPCFLTPPPYLTFSD
jgi:hypothetical protein